MAVQGESGGAAPVDGGAAAGGAGPAALASVAHEGTVSIGVGGGVGQSFAVVEENWACEDCKAVNRATHNRCKRCRAKRPAGSRVPVWSEAAKADAGLAPVTNWREAMDPRTRQIYYYNSVTGQTQWSRPMEMGPAPLGTGYFGRGAAGSTQQEDLMAKTKEWMKRPARVQAAHLNPKKFQRIEGSNEYNLWYHRYVGDQWRAGLGKEPAETRCVAEKDSGLTAADSSTEGAPFCVHFARGMCWKGKDCTFLHRIPTAVDDANVDPSTDVFGRERHAGHRDDMGGVGSFNDDCRTLYVGKLSCPAGEDTQEVVFRHFSEWGEVENINVIKRLKVAFVRYRLRSNAEFAKEAMANQALDNNEVLNIRWAMDDPNPVAAQGSARANEDAAIAAMQAHGVQVTGGPDELPDAPAAGAAAGGGGAGGGAAGATLSLEDGAAAVRGREDDGAAGDEGRAKRSRVEGDGEDAGEIEQIPHVPPIAALGGSVAALAKSVAQAEAAAPAEAGDSGS